MYSSEKNPGLNWKDLIIKAIFLVVFVLLLMWLFPKVPNMKPFYSNVFRENIKYMQDAAESYYTNERLPKNIGDTSEMTLQEMINKNIILPFVDQDGNECDTSASYVQVKKNKNDYILKVNLVCPTEKNYVEKTLGCYTYCEDCEEEKLEYQFKKEVTSNKISYSCPSGGTLKNGICYVYKTDSYKATETTEKGTYYCPKGGILNGTTCYVTQNSSYQASVSTGGYYCPDGGTLNGTTCYVSKETSYAATTNYTCPNGGVLSNGTCYTTSLSSNTYRASVLNYTCPNGNVQGSSNCSTTSAGSSYQASVRNYTCPNGTVQNSSSCTTTTAGSTINATARTTTKRTKSTTTKGAGYTLVSQGYEYTCSNHALCPKRVYYYTYDYKTTTYSCPTGYTRNGTKCYKSGSSTTVQGTPNYYCPYGGTLSNGRCTKAGTTSYVQGTPNYYCPYGGTPTNGTCYKTSTVGNSYIASIQRTCPDGTTAINGRCYVNTTYTYNASKGADTKYCPKGGTLNKEGKCVVDSSYSYNASITNGKSVLTCPNGGELKDKKCYTTSVKSSYKAKSTTKKVKSYQYKWSAEEKLEGWTATGEKRKLTEDK